MKAILNINKKSQYAKFNGLTFVVGDLTHSGVGLVGLNSMFPQNQTDFSFNEIIIVDIVDEILNTNEGLKILKLKKYLEINKIKILD